MPISRRVFLPGGSAVPHLPHLLCHRVRHPACCRHQRPGVGRKVYDTLNGDLPERVRRHAWTYHATPDVMHATPDMPHPSISPPHANIDTPTDPLSVCACISVCCVSACVRVRVSCVYVCVCVVCVCVCVCVQLIGGPGIFRGDGSNQRAADTLCVLPLQTV
jgi:hypothetical protein